MDIQWFYYWFVADIIDFDQIYTNDVNSGSQVNILLRRFQPNLKRAQFRKASEFVDVRAGTSYHGQITQPGDD
jgi:hypothetical protein